MGMEPMDWKKTVVRITKEVRKEIQLAGEEITDRQVAEMTEERVLNDPELEEEDFRLKVRIVNQIFYTLRRDMGILEPLLQDDEISEIMVNGTDSIYIEKKGKTEKLEMAFASTEELQIPGQCRIQQRCPGWTGFDDSEVPGKTLDHGASDPYRNHYPGGSRIPAKIGAGGF